MIDLSCKSWENEADMLFVMKPSVKNKVRKKMIPTWKNKTKSMNVTT